VILLVELEDDGVADLGSDVGWAKREDAWTTDDDSVFGASASDGRRACWWKRCSGRCRGRSNRRCGCSCGRGRCWWGSGARCSGQELVKLAIWVDGKHHSLLTVIALSAVDPERLVTLDCELCKGEIWVRHSVSDGNAEIIVRYDGLTLCWLLTIHCQSHRRQEDMVAPEWTE